MKLSQRIAFILITLSLAGIQGCAEDKKVPGAQYILDATMTLSDGTVLAMDIVLPQGEGPFPVMLWRTPYNKDGVTQGEIRQFVEKGYAAVSMDTRGRFKSDGAWDPFRYERGDGFETHEWIGKQKWCNGSIGLAGGSYLGFTQCIAAPEGSKFVKAMVPEVPWGNTYRDCLYTGGAYHLLLGQFWGALQTLAGMHTPPADLPKTIPDFDKDRLFFHLPLAAWDDCLGVKIQYLRDWVAHPTHDDYWKACEVGDRIENLQCAALYVGGWFDIFTDGVLEYWIAARTRAASESARKHQYLVMGPWNHGGSADDGKVGDMNFGPQSSFKKSKSRMAFLDEMVRGQDTGFSREQPPIRYYVMGANHWRDDDEWPPRESQPTPFYLAADGPANSLAGSGALAWEKPAEANPSDTFVYDPQNPVPTCGGSLLWPTAGPRDQSEVEKRADVLVYSSPVLSETVEVTGPVFLKLFAASTATDTDFTAKLVDVAPGPDGKEIPYGITDGILRARFRESDKQTSLIEPGKVYEYTIEMGNTSIAFLPGHRIRLEVSSSNFPRFDRNPNTGHAFGADADLVSATQTIFHSSQYASHLLLPILKQ